MTPALMALLALWCGSADLAKVEFNPVKKTLEIRCLTPYVPSPIPGSSSITLPVPSLKATWNSSFIPVEPSKKAPKK